MGSMDAKLGVPWRQDEGMLTKGEGHGGDKHKEHHHTYHHTVRNDGRPSTLQEATPISMTLFFGGFTRKSPFRMKCFEIYNSSSWAGFFFTVTLANCIYIGIAPAVSDAEFDTGPGISAGEIFDYICVLILVAEMFSGCVAIGAFEGDHTWLRCSNYHKLDLIVLMVTVSEFIASIYGVRGLTLRPFRLLRVFRAVTTVKMFYGVKAIIKTLSKGAGQLATVLAMLIFFMAAFSICGMAIFGTSFRRRCVSLTRPVPACASDYSTGWTEQCTFATGESS